MGVDPEIEYGPDCVPCFEADKTPLYVYASFTGIVPGHAWFPEAPAAPNGIFKLIQIGHCRWQKLTPAVHIEFTLNVPGTALWMRLEGDKDAFSFDDPANCIFQMDNWLAFPPGWVYEYGKAKISWKG